MPFYDGWKGIVLTELFYFGQPLSLTLSKTMLVQTSDAANPVTPDPARLFWNKENYYLINILKKLTIQLSFLHIRAKF